MATVSPAPVNAHGYSPVYLAKRAARYANPDPLHGWLRPDLFARIAPPATPEQPEYKSTWDNGYRTWEWERDWAVWWEANWPRLKDLSRDEFNLLILQVIPDADPRFLDRIPLPKYCDPGFTGPAQIRRIPHMQAASPNARIANAHPLLLHITGVALYLAGLGRQGRKPKPHSDLIVAPSSRAMAGILGVSRQHLMRVIKYQGGPLEVLEQLSVATPADGAGKAVKGGCRRASEAHPTNTYRLFVSDEAIQVARDLQARLGDPERPEAVLRSEVEWIEDEAPLSDKAPAEKWYEVIQAIRARIPLTTTLRLFRKLRPVTFDGETLTVTGAVSPQAAIILARVRSCRIELANATWLR